MGALMFTQDGKAVEVEQVWIVSAKQDSEGRWIQMGGRVALLPNGVYCHGDGNLLPFESVEDIKQVFASLDRDGQPIILPEMEELMGKVLEWFENRDQQEGQVIQRVVLNRKGYPELEDGTPAYEKEIYDYFEPGPALTAAIVGMSKREEEGAEMRRTAVPSIYKAAPEKPKEPVAPKAAPKKTSKGWSKERLIRSREMKAAKAAQAQATPNPTSAEATEAAVTG